MAEVMVCFKNTARITSKMASLVVYVLSFIDFSNESSDKSNVSSQKTVLSTALRYMPPSRIILLVFNHVFTVLQWELTDMTGQ